jgi:hypothetical protein
LSRRLDFIEKPCHAMTHLQQLRQHLIHAILARALERDAEIANAVERFEGEVRFVDGELVFTLPHLYRFALHHLESSGHAVNPIRCDYPAFRRMLYQSAVNTELRDFGARVVVERADDDHALSLYRLTRVG